MNRTTIGLIDADDSLGGADLRVWAHGGAYPRAPPHPSIASMGGAGAGPGPLRSAASSGLRRAPPGRLPAPSAMSSIRPTLPRPAGPAPPPVPPSHRWPWRLGGGGGGLHRQLDVARNRAIDASREAAGGRSRERPDYREPRAGHQHRAGRVAAGEGGRNSGRRRHPPHGLDGRPSRPIRRCRRFENFALHVEALPYPA
jgi:hypothetical protein